MTKIHEKIAENIFFIAGLISAMISIVIFGFLFFLGFPLLKAGHFSDLLLKTWAPYHGTYGIYPMIIGTLTIGLLSTALAFPLSLGCASLISILSPRRLSYCLHKVVQIMTGIPTVIYGFVGVFLLVPIVREIFHQGSGMCILSASLMLAILISPTMILFFVDSFDQVPKTYLDAVDSIGGNKVQKLLYVMIPSAWRGIVTGVILGIGRAMGDTLIALMIAGNAVQVPRSILDSARTLTSHIALVFAADYESMEFKSIFMCGMILYLFTTFIVLGIRSSVSRNNEKQR